MARAPLMPVDDAREAILAKAKLTSTIEVPLAEAGGYFLAKNLKAKRTQPPFSASAMDGYAVRASDLDLSSPLNVIGESAAGHGFKGDIGEQECVRIFTGAPLPASADTILIQEDVTKQPDGSIMPTEAPLKGTYVRHAGCDFSEGETFIKAGRKLDFRALGLAASMNHPTLKVHKKPRVGILANGDELILPGGTPSADQIIASNTFAVIDLVNRYGGEAIDLGIAPDTEADIQAHLEKARAKRCDILVTLGGASVGDHDLIQKALRAAGMNLNLWRIAMRPGKPFMFGELDDMLVLGMPGNPVSSVVCALLFLLPLMARMQQASYELNLLPAQYEGRLGKNDLREEYRRGHMWVEGNVLKATSFDRQDSSLLSILNDTKCLIRRKAHAGVTNSGDECLIVPLDNPIRPVS